MNVKQEIALKLHTNLDKEELVLLKFTKAEAKQQLKWEHSKEFEHNGSMYDVVEKKIEGDTTYYLCIFDNKETELNKRFENLFSYSLGNLKESHNSPKWLSNIFKSLYYNKKDIILNPFYKVIQPFTYKSLSYISYSTSPPNPPPEKF